MYNMHNGSFNWMLQTTRRILRQYETFPEPTRDFAMAQLASKPESYSYMLCSISACEYPRTFLIYTVLTIIVVTGCFGPSVEAA